jgi:hypothetical protein
MHHILYLYFNIILSMQLKTDHIDEKTERRLSVYTYLYRLLNHFFIFLI